MALQYFDNVASMQAATLEAGSTVVTRGFYAADDGGGATYLIGASGTGDGYFSFSTAGGRIARLQVENDTVNIRQIGAKGDGVTDDTAVINKATQSAYKSVYAPAGTYIVTPYYRNESDPNKELNKAAIWLAPYGRNLYGEGQENTIFKVSANAGQYKTVIGSISSYVEGITMRDFTIDQNIQNNPVMPVEGPSGNGLKLYCILLTMHLCTIERVTFRHQGSNAIYVSNASNLSDGYRIQNCYFEFDMNRAATTKNYDNSALYCVGTNFSLCDNRITTLFEVGETLPGDDSVILCGRGGIENHGKGAFICRNSIDKYHSGINYTGRAPDPDAYGNVSGNMITNACIGIAFYGNDQIEPVDVGVKGVKCENNDIRLIFSYQYDFPTGILTMNSRCSLKNCSFIGNTITFDRSTYDETRSPALKLCGGIMLQSWTLQDIYIKGNVIVNAPGIGILVNRQTIRSCSLRNFFVDGNQLIDCGWCRKAYLVNEQDVVEDARICQLRAGIKLWPERAGRNELSNVFITNNCIIDTSEEGQCIHSIDVPKALVDDGKVFVQDNIEQSVSGAGFYTPAMDSINDQPYERIPAIKAVGASIPAGSYYAGQLLIQPSAQTGVSHLVCTASGVWGKSLPENLTGSIDLNVNSTVITLSSAQHGIQSGDTIVISNASSERTIPVLAVNGATLYTEALDLNGIVSVAYGPQAVFSSSGKTAGTVALPETGRIDAEVIIAYTAVGSTTGGNGELVHANGSLTVGNSSVELPELRMQDTVEVNALTGNGTITHNTEVAALSSMSWFENTSKSSKTSLFVAANNPLENAFPHADDQFPEDVVSDYFTICRVHDIYPYPETTTVGLTVGRANAVRVRISRQTLIDDGYADTLDGFKKWIEDKDLKVAYLTTQPTTEAYQANSLLASSSGTVSLTGGYTAGTLTASTVQAQLSASAG